ncbi:hypothetical protein HPB52_008641 [Rhipicephalus sanguineus]|uniref:Reverse transcriptase domain-containing protein n=1 Tax=Rhipicephalus sanguineus TaxID=34632 RepID=A0A9D4QCX6_RHISA|nr:hypothetical protein HPB52_008641 [Rhipicephalus sanguineus]
MAPTFFRLLAPQVLVFLCTVFQSLLDHGTVPASRNRALVTPVHKGKSKPSNDPKNYRPVSITSIICRTFERVLNSQLLDFLERRKFFPASQHGFRRDRSCDTALATLNQIVSHNLDNRVETDVIQLDLSNAFDTLNISLLLDKAKEAGIRGCLLGWLANFLIGRSQRVLYCGAHSKRIPVPSGVPQGSVLAPTLFLIYVNNMPRDNRFPLVQYADDTSILAPILCPSTSEDLQEYLMVIDSWITSNHLKLSPEKCSVMKFSSARLPAKPSYTMRGIPLPTEDSLKILGVTFTSTLDFSLQVASVVARARRVLGFVSRVSKPCGPATFALLYTSLVLPILEYGCPVWSPNQRHLIARIESVQRRASRILYARSIKSPPADYTTRLKMAKWRPLRQRRAVTQMRLLCRLLDGYLADTPLSCSGHAPLLGKKNQMKKKTERGRTVMADKPAKTSPSRSQRSPSPAKATDRDAASKRDAGSPPRKATSPSPSKSRGSPPKRSRSPSPSPVRSVAGSPSRRRRKTSPLSSPRSRSPRSRSPRSPSPRMSSRSPRATVSGTRRPSTTGKWARRFRSKINAAIERDHERRSRIYQWLKGSELHMPMHFTYIERATFGSAAEKFLPYLLVPRRNGAFPLREDRARDRVRGWAKPRRRVQMGTLRVRPTSTHEPRVSTVERVPWAQSSGINGRGVDLRDITRADQAPSYGIDRWSTHDAFDSATPSAPTTNCTPLLDYFA